ncbi:MAG TPA: hypothetical protein VGE38_00310 [Nocardioides sp.]|uniref:hypothetical protein n=1 Tax=Nocardioides sp. TaxID=35761 RepID=UPI002ED81374
MTTTVSRRAFLHIGPPKTGTTFLQQVLWRQRELAVQHGLLLPLGSVRDHFRASLDLRGIETAPEGAPVTGSWDRLLAALTAWDGDVLVSHEMFAALDDAAAARALADLAGSDREVHVVVTARDLGRQLPAVWQEAVKGRRSFTFAEFMAQLEQPGSEFAGYLQDRQDYAGLLRRWSGPGVRRHLVTVPPPGAPRDLLWRRFAGVLGLPADAFELDVRANDALGAEQLELLRRLNERLGERLPWPGSYAPVVRGLFARRVLARQAGRRIAAGGADLAFARDRARQQVAALEDLVGADGVELAGALTDLLVADDVGSAGDARQQVADERLLAEAVEATVGLLETLAEERARHHAELARLRERIRALEQG